jgi:hypothetical protein
MQSASLSMKPVQIETGGADQEGFLVFADGRLVAVLVRLSAEHEGLAGRWFFEHGFGRLDAPTHPIFVDSEEAEAWIAAHLG